MTSIMQNIKAEKLRWLADNLDSAIECKFASRTENTPKQQRQAGEARLEGCKLKRTQEALYTLAGLHEQNKVSDLLAGFTSKKKVYDAMSSDFEKGNNGYYDIPVATNTPRHATPENLALWELITGQTEEEKHAEKLKQKINGLKFAKIPGYFVTPDSVIKLMAEKAGLDCASGGAILLEPSAGSGAILDYVSNHFPEIGLDYFEINYTLNTILQDKGYPIVGDNFIKADITQRYDYILMNPPFENLLDIDHVRKAYLCLRDEGCVVAIMSPSPFFRGTKKAVHFRIWFESVGGEVEDLPKDSFKESGTGVASKIIVINK